MTRRFSSYDHALGPRADRYFGDGYRRVHQTLSEASVEAPSAGASSYIATASLDYPSDWSVKRSGTLVAHVSTIDTVALATAICETALAHMRDLTADEVAHMWVQRVAVRAGTEPHNDLQRIPVRATVATSSRADETTFRFQVANLSGDLTMRHPPGRGHHSPPGGVAKRALADARYGRHPFLDGFKDQYMSASNIVVDEKCTAITARHRVEMIGSADVTYRGAEAAYPRSMSVLQALIGAAQLAEILLYQLDSLERTQSTTLWMRRLELVAHGPVRPIEDPFDTALVVRRATLTEHQGQRWRHGHFEVTQFNGLTGTATASHRLPSQ